MVRVEITDLVTNYSQLAVVRIFPPRIIVITGGNLMPNVLEELYYGNISPAERSIRPGSNVQKALQKRDTLESKLNELLTDEQRATFEQYLSLSAEILDANCLDSFINGFRLGAQFALDMFIGTDAPYADMIPDIS